MSAVPEIRRSAGSKVWRWVRRNKAASLGATIMVIVTLAAILAPWIAPYDPDEQNIILNLGPPTAEHWLGNDTYGRDTLSRIIWGARVSLFVSITSISLAMVIGGAFGVVAGYFGGRTDRIIMASMDVLLSFPSLVMGLLVVAVLGPTMMNLIVAIAFTAIAPFARIARAPTLSIRNREFVEAGRTIGFSDLKIMVRYIIPNIADEVVVLGTLWLATAVRTEASLSFIGLGVRPPTPTWGGMIRDGFENMLDAPWLVIFPSLAILTVMIALNLLGDGLRDATDPRLRHE
ncbi:ABC transporter permease [Chelatococcus asaccharovorans]|uniref:Peptide/nickel transport system permease protein n=1 Tax=Chelatococcus asaccharovorans TaxID=28210 RepID=A0A2V3U9E3_9HYPH|nr:ABC transporter permease [Chelatococcus asaccharovorans]MBS7704724.1 ABC transporter permease [Chelatococcus asaccharovorans]PXW54625.1 peptide/nickel transport system permease protein [Chelatococcus asaccharovorans]CAH1649474.1 Glutathione transport system permease protein GsiD [Chelatococcus asaccharovorans]CAH1687001.1 Glutathione transport system permease protein GsiD [Chelatococcus asaccharovorans]